MCNERKNYMQILNVNTASALGVFASFLLENINPILSTLMIASVFVFNVVKIYQALNSKKAEAKEID